MKLLILLLFTTFLYAEAALTIQEKDALSSLLLAFPSLASIPTSFHFFENNYAGGSWLGSPDDLCLGDDGYEWHGLKCVGGHIRALSLYVLGLLRIF
jgi:hypothetical protein